MPRKPFTAIDPFLPGFKHCLTKLSPEARELAKKAMRDLLLPEIPPEYNFRRFDGYSSGNVYVITFGENSEYMMSMGVADGVAYLRRAGPCKEIDETP
jgi:hypothetical protein